MIKNYKITFGGIAGLQNSNAILYYRA